MKKIINWILLLGTVISTIVALKYSSLPVPVFVPDRLSEFWISSIEEQQEYVLLYDIAVGFILSALFYFVVEEIPDRVRKHKAKHLINLQINQLLEHMEQIISIVIAKYKRNGNLKELAQKDFLILDGETRLSMEEISYLTTTYYTKTRKKKTAVHQYGTVNNAVKDNLKYILDNISQIKNYEYFYASDSLLVECLRRIEGCNLIRYYHKNNDILKKTPCFQLHGTSTAMVEFVSLYLQLLKLKFHTEYTITTLDSKEVTERYHNDRETGALLQSVFDIQKERQEIATANPTVVISSRKYTTDILISQLKQRLTATYFFIDDIQKESLEGFKFIVFVVDSISKNAVIHLLKEIDMQSEILLLTERNIFRKGIKDKNRHNKRIIGEIFFKSCFKAKYLPVVYYKEEPSEKSIVAIASQIETILYGKHK